MDTSRLTLDHFLSRFQLLRPQITHETLNQRQAAVLILWFAAPTGAAVDPAGYSFAQTRRTGRLSRRGRGQYRCFAYRRSASRSAGGSRHPAASRGSDWRFTAGRQRDRFSGHPGGRHYSAKSPWRASEDEVSAVFEMPLAQALQLGRYHPLDVYRRGNSHRVWLSWYEHYFVWGMTANILRELALQIGVKP